MDNNDQDDPPSYIEDANAAAEKGEGYLTFYRDPDWNKRAVTYPGTEKWDILYDYVVRPGLVATIEGQEIVYLDTGNHWVSLVSSSAALRVAQMVGDDKVSVNYAVSFDPYYPSLSKHANFNSCVVVPRSICVGTKRLTVELVGEHKVLRMRECEPILSNRVRSVPPYVYSACYLPANHVEIPHTYVFPGRVTVIDFLRPLFPDIRTMLTYMWIIGNCIVEPIARPRCLMLCGTGGTGKSTSLRMANAALSGACGLLPDNVLTSNLKTDAEKVATTVVKSRLATCYELDLVNKRVNMSILKSITGSDFVRVYEYQARAICSLMIATNGIPNMTLDPEFAEDALSRRVVCIYMDVDTSMAPPDPDPAAAEDKSDFLCACVHTRLRFKDLPISPLNFLLTITGSAYHTAIELIGEVDDSEVSDLGGREVLATISGLLCSTIEKTEARCRLVSMSAVRKTTFGYVIRGLKLKHSV